MKTKICTSLEQSKKLIELGIDINTADMHYVLIDSDEEIYDIGFGNYIGILPHYSAWSLAALLELIPFHIIINNKRYGFSMIKGLDKNGETYAIKYVIFNTTFYLYLTDFYNNPLDAVFELIVWLKENGKI